MNAKNGLEFTGTPTNKGFRLPSINNRLLALLLLLQMVIYVGESMNDWIYQ